MSKKISTVLCLLALLLAAMSPMSAFAADEAATGTTGATSATDVAPLTMTPEEIAAAQAEATGSETGSNQSFLDDAGNFITDNAPYVIIGIVVLAAILAGFFIMRGRRRPAAAAAAGGAGSAPASVPSATEIRRRKRAAMQRSREEERLRRKAGYDERQLTQSPSLPLSANRPQDPIEAEKQAARDQLQAAAAVARSGPVPIAGAVPAPATPSQTAPAAGVLSSSGVKAETTFASGTPAAAELAAASAAAAGRPAPMTPQQASAQPMEASSQHSEEHPVAAEPSTQVHQTPEQTLEPPVEAPGLDAKVGEAAAGFAAGAAGGGLAARAASGSGDQPEAEVEAVADQPAAADEGAAHEAEERLRAKVAEIKAEQGRIPVPPPAAPAAMPEAGNEIEEAVPPAPSSLAAVEMRLQQNSDERSRTLEQAEERLQRIEQRAEDAERRAAFAERLAQLNVEESDRERRLSEVITGIDRAEERAIEAEVRAKAAEKAAASAFEVYSSTELRERSAGSVRQAQADTPGAQAKRPEPAPAAADDVRPAPVDTPAAEPTSPGAKAPLFGGRTSASPGSSGSLNLNSATFEELRDADLSVTQATRILAYRERFGGYRSIEDLEKVPGFPAELIESLRGRITV